jgi:hypothetical protein
MQRQEGWHTQLGRCSMAQALLVAHTAIARGGLQLACKQCRWGGALGGGWCAHTSSMCGSSRRCEGWPRLLAGQVYPHQGLEQCCRQQQQP